MNIQELAKLYLKDALTKGSFVLPESGEVKEFTASEILNLAKYVLKEGIILDDNQKISASNIPSDFGVYNPNVTTNAVSQITVPIDNSAQIQLPLNEDIFESLPRFSHEGK